MSITRGRARRARSPLVLVLLLLLTGCPSSPSDRVPPIPSAIMISPRQVELTTIGDTATLSATVVDPGGRAIAGAPVEWSSTRLDVATVSASGTVTAVGAGTTTIRAESEGLSDFIEATVVLEGGS